MAHRTTVTTVYAQDLLFKDFAFHDGGAYHINMNSSEVHRGIAGTTSSFNLICESTIKKHMSGRISF